jgi:catechol 2,3-dioxygenase-like lactoylglutathione lyase family enzyme
MLNHIGILVEDLEEGISRYSKILGVRFRPPFHGKFAGLEQNGVVAPAELLLTYSMEGPVYVELMQATGDGVWSAKHGFGLHHFGGFVSDITAQTRRLAQAGLRPEASAYTPGGELLLSYFRPGDLMGTRYELLSEKLRPGWETWVAGGPPPGHGD